MFEENTKNGKKRDLLFNNPNQFLLENQYVIKIIVARFIRYGFVYSDERDELIQFINARLLHGILRKMKEQYNPSFCVSTYFATEINNLRKEFLNKYKKNNNLISIEDFSSPEQHLSEEQLKLLINEEIERLEIILRLYHSKKKKVILALKIKYHITIEVEDISDLSNMPVDELEKIFMMDNNQLWQFKTENQIFDYYAGLIGKFNEKKLMGELFKHWTYTKINEIIQLLNKDGKESSYDQETFGMLFEKYSDCEDRSILFSALANNLLNPDVLLLDYPDHIATAVSIHDVIGDKIYYNGREFLICDPTYLGAEIGMCMPDYKKIHRK